MNQLQCDLLAPGQNRRRTQKIVGRPSSAFFLFSMVCSTGLYITGCASPQQTYPVPYGSPYPGGVMTGAPINPGVYSPPVINAPVGNTMVQPPGYTTGTVPTAGVAQPNGLPAGQNYPYGTVPPINNTLPTYGAPQGAYQPGYPQTGYPPVGYPQGVPLNSMMQPSTPILFGR